MFNLLVYFLSGGLFTTIIILAEGSGQRLISGLAILMPTFTLIAYLFIGMNQGGVALSQNAKLVLVGTFFTWLPYMLSIIYLAPLMNTTRAIGTSLLLFLVLALIYLLLVQHFGWFQ